MRIDAVIRKYNLQWDEQFVSPLKKVSKKEKRFKLANIDAGHILGRFVTANVDTGTDYVHGLYRTLFAKEIIFNSSNETIKCYGWVIVDKDKYEEHIKNLYKQYELACELKKKHQERIKLMKLQRDFK